MKNINEIVKSINVFLNNTTKEKEMLFKKGQYLKLIKHTKKGKKFIEIHTSGYDDILEIEEAIEWIKWELLDLQANNFI